MPAGDADLIRPDVAEQIAAGRHANPFAVLGCHRHGDAWVVRVFVPGAEAVALERPDGTLIATLEVGPADGVFLAELPAHPGRYRLQARRRADRWIVDDAYQYGPIIGPQDEHYFSEGTHERLWEILGAHPRTHEGVEGVSFAVWAPAARRVSVIGDFNGWDGRRHAMRTRGATGIWEIFVPNLDEGARYKYEIVGADGHLAPLKADPVGFGAQVRPENCSVVRRLNGYVWRDDAFMARRYDVNRVDRPISIYEAHAGSWRRHPDGRWYSYRELAAHLVPYVKDMGFTHIELMPISEYPFDGSWGYQPIGLFAPTSRFGAPDDFRALVDACHQAGLGLIVDWVPGHFPTDPHGLVRFDGTALYEHQDPREGFHPDWNTLIYNYGRVEVANFLIANALYWAEIFHIDGLRVDAVASMLYRDYSRREGEWIPNHHGGRENLEAIAFMRRMNAVFYAKAPSAMTIAEESTAWPGVSRPVHDGGLGFGFKWNMGWMNDTLDYMSTDPLYRKYHHSRISFGLHYAFSENFILPLSHDEVVHGKGSIFARMPGDDPAKFANLRAYYGFMFAHPGKKLLFMGQELAQRSEWRHDAELDWGALQNARHAGVQTLIRDLNRIYRETPALHVLDAQPEGFEWIDGAAKAANVFAWLRKGPADTPPVLCVMNFSGQEHRNWRIGVPRGGRWTEIFNSDAEVYGGAGGGNLGGVDAENVESHGRSHALKLTLPALSTLFLIPA